MNILECSTKGDKRFSAFYAKVTVFGKEDSIENHYQLCKRIGEITPKTWKDVKGKNPTHIEINNIRMDTKYLSQWYKLLWLTYFTFNPSLVAYASKFDDYNDIFKGKSINCQADVIRQYIKMGRESILNDCKELLDLLNPKPTVVNMYHEVPYDVYIGRGSKWGNPFSHLLNTQAIFKVDTREESIEMYRKWIMQKPNLLEELHELKGKTLGCFCKPKPCHGDVLIELIDRLAEE
nr:DUF4326 domain-containing protein [Bacillus wiedmannii]